MKKSNNYYSLGEDFYNFYIVEKEINPNDISKIKVSNEKDGNSNENDFNVDLSGNAAEASVS